MVHTTATQIAVHTCCYVNAGCCKCASIQFTSVPRVLLAVAKLRTSASFVRTMYPVVSFRMCTGRFGSGLMVKELTRGTWICILSLWCTCFRRSVRTSLRTCAIGRGLIQCFNTTIINLL